MRRIALALAIALAAAGLFLWLRHASDEDAIRGQLTRIAAALHTTEGSNPVFRLPRVRDEFDAVLDETVHVHVDEMPVTLPTDRRGLAQTAVQVTGYYPSVKLGFRDIDIKLDDAKTMAQVTTTADLTTGGEHGTRDTRAVSLLFYKRDGTWRITSVTVWGADAAGK
jgi:hypothetical protein